MVVVGREGGATSTERPGIAGARKGTAAVTIRGDPIAARIGHGTAAACRPSHGRDHGPKGGGRATAAKVVCTGQRESETAATVSATTLATERAAATDSHRRRRWHRREKLNIINYP